MLPKAVAEHLDLDVARLLDVFLDKDPVVGKARFGLARRRTEPVARLLVARGDTHSLAAAAGRRLDHDRVADVAGDGDRAIGVRDNGEVPRHARYPGVPGQLLRLDLVAHRRDRLGPRPDEGHSGLGEGVAQRRGFPTKSRSRDGPPRRRSFGRPRRSARSSDSSRPMERARSERPRRPSAHAMPRHPPRNRPRPSRSPSAARCE